MSSSSIRTPWKTIRPSVRLTAPEAHERGQATVDVVGLGKVIELGQALLLPGRLEGQASVAEKAAGYRPAVGHVGDPLERHRCDLPREDAGDLEDARRGDVDPVRPPVQRASRRSGQRRSGRPFRTSCR